MAEAPKPSPGWYPDSELVDTLRYWDGTGWTEHRAPASSEPRFSPPSESTSGSTAAGDSNPRTKNKMGTGWKVVFVISGVLLVGGAGILIKSSMDSNIQAGRELADAMTTDRGEQAAVAEAFGNELVIPEPSSAVEVIGCGSPSVDLTSGLWFGELTVPSNGDGPKTTQFREDCSLDITDGMVNITWESYGDSVALMNDDYFNCVGEVNSSGDEISLICTRVFNGEEDIYETTLTRR